MRGYYRLIACGLLVAVLTDLASNAQDSTALQKARQISDGFYLLRGQGSKPSDFDQRNQGERLIAGAGSDSETLYLVRPTPDVPLALASEPRIVGNLPQERRLAIQLADAQKEKMATFTRRHLGGRVAMVVDERVVMTVKIRSVIAEGRFEVSTCDGDLADLEKTLGGKLQAR